MLQCFFYSIYRYIVFNYEYINTIYNKNKYIYLLLLLGNGLPYVLNFYFGIDFEAVRRDA